MGDRRANLAAALRALTDLGEIAGVSSVYETDPVGDPNQPVYWNLVVRLRTALEPRPLLHALKMVEHRLGRRPTHRFGPRVIDLDLLLDAQYRVATPELEVPHPRMMERAFVLLPLAELDPGLVHPVTGERIADRVPMGGLERAVRLFAGAELLPDHAAAHGPPT